MGGQPPSLGAPPPLSGGAGGEAGSWRSPGQGRSRSHIGGLRLLASAVTRGCLVGEGWLNLSIYMSICLLAQAVPEQRTRAAL
jgi:hypothetical protein